MSYVTPLDGKVWGGERERECEIVKVFFAATHLFLYVEHIISLKKGEAKKRKYQWRKKSRKNGCQLFPNRFLFFFWFCFLPLFF